MTESQQPSDEAVVASALEHFTTANGRVLLVVRLRSAYACSAFWNFPPLADASTRRYALVYAGAVSSLLRADLWKTRDALLTAAAGVPTLDNPAAEPLELGGALVGCIEAGVLAKELLRPSPRHFFLLSGDAGENIFSTPQGGSLKSTVTDPKHGIISSRSFVSKMVGTTSGFVRKLRGLGVPRAARKSSRRGAQKVEPTAETLLEVLPATDVFAHLELCRSWSITAANCGRCDSDRLKELQDAMAMALKPDVATPSIGPVLDQWLLAITAAMPPSDGSTGTEEPERTANVRAAVGDWLRAVRDADLQVFVSDCPTPQASAALANEVPSVRLRSLLQTLDPRALLPSCQVAFVVQSGSAMYNLATASSDEDYLLVFVASPSELLGFEPPADQIEFKGEKVIGFGKDKGGVVEGSAMELGRYVSLLCKGNPMVLEPLYVAAGSAVHSSSVWRELQAIRRRCLFTQRAARQYLGFVDDRLRKARKALEKSEFKAASKYLYHGMHKLSQLRSILVADEPRIHLLPDGGPESDYERIMRVRLCVSVVGTDDVGLQTARAEQVLRTELFVAAEELTQLQEGSFEASVATFPEEVDFEQLGNWLLSVRARIYNQEIAGKASVAPDDGQDLRRQSSIPKLAPALHARQISTSSSGSGVPSAAGDDCGHCDVLHKDDTQYVRSVLSQFQQEEHVRLVFAAERSSRSYGWAHVDSDHDILAIFICNRREYFGLTAPRRATSREYPAADGQCAIGVYGWELKHACTLALASNPTLLDALRSPFVYVDLLLPVPNDVQHTWGRKMLQTAFARYDQRALAQSYLAHAKKDLREQVQRAGAEGARRKKYLNIIRAILSAHVLLRSGDLQPFPLAINDESFEQGDVRVVGNDHERSRTWPPIDLPTLLAQADETSISSAAREILYDWLSPEALASGLPGLPIANNDPAALEIERCIDANIEQLHGPIKAALPPKHWRSKGEEKEVEREVERREAAINDFTALCEELLEAETRFS